MLHSTIVSSGAFLPKQVVTTKSLLAEAQTENYGILCTAIESEMGIHAIRFANADMEYSELAALAAEEAINDGSSISPDQIDGIIYCGIERDYKEPSTAHNVANRLGISPALCFDIANACHGFSSGIQVADSLIRTHSCQFILLVTAEMGSKMIRQAIDKSRRKDIHLNNPLLQLGAFSMGDAGGAMIMGATSEENGFQSINVRSQAQYSDLCYYKHVNGVLDGRMDMAKVCARTISLNNKMTTETLDNLNWSTSSIDLLIAHQVGVKPYYKILKSLAISEDKTIKTFPELGNIASATIPVNFSLLKDAGRIKPEQRILILSSGSGISVSQTGLIT